jgi:hypothetical protein
MVAVVEKVMVHAVEVASVGQKTRQSKVHQDINTDMVMAWYPTCSGVLVYRKRLLQRWNVQRQQ